jgi:hypothetical protein
MLVPEWVPETLYLCISGSIDQYLSHTCITRKQLHQLLGITSLHIACKYKETEHIVVEDFACVAELIYLWQDILDMEAHIVQILRLFL